uniref:tetratricopeptide repeat protein n=1 Tax=Psychrobacter sp. TaxID=56811 RepID=UPI0015983C05|nr:tetratricopeptide repeat protein [Psychrobacter sp.]QJS05938.1 sel1 repeat protein [Psychrobacter sp.]
MTILLTKNKFDYRLVILSLAFALSLSACAKVTERTANNGDAEAQFKMGMYYFDGSGGVSTDYYKAGDWFQKSAAQGYAPAQLALGEAYGKGRGVRQDYEKSLAWFQKSAAQGHAPAQLALGSMYNLSWGYRDYPYSYKDTELAKEWFGMACDGGSQEGCSSYRALN